MVIYFWQKKKKRPSPVSTCQSFTLTFWPLKTKPLRATRLYTSASFERRESGVGQRAKTGWQNCAGVKVPSTGDGLHPVAVRTHWRSTPSFKKKYWDEIIIFVFLKALGSSLRNGQLEAHNPVRRPLPIQGADRRRVGSRKTSPRAGPSRRVRMRTRGMLGFLHWRQSGWQGS